jgi:tetratricopeptide (TPR) repeat protein
MHVLTNVLTAQHRYAEAEKIYRELIEGRRRILGADHPDTLAAMSGLAMVIARDRPAEGEKLLRDVVDGFQRRLGAEHPETLKATSKLASAIQRQGRYGEAARLYDETARLQRKALGPRSPDLGLTLANEAMGAMRQGDRARALGLLREALESGLLPSALEELRAGDFASLKGDPEFEALVAGGGPR